MRRIKFNPFKLELEIYHNNDFIENYRDFKKLARGGFLGYQGQLEIKKFSNTMLLSYFTYIVLNKKFNFMKEVGWSEIDNDIFFIDKYIEKILKKEKLLAIFDDDVLIYYFATAKIEKIKKLIEKYNLNKKKDYKEYLEYIQYGLWFRGIFENEKIFNALKKYLKLILYSCNPYINHPGVIKKEIAEVIFPLIENKEFKEKFKIIN